MRDRRAPEGLDESEFVSLPYKNEKEGMKQLKAKLGIEQDSLTKQRYKGKATESQNFFAD